MLSPNTEAILLLTANLADKEDGLNPLTINEWAKFSSFLINEKLQPKDLLNNDLEIILKSFEDQKITIARIQKLTKRGARLAIVIDKWLKTGMWILTRADDEYPKRLKTKLKLKAPPVIYGFGNKKILNHRKILACVGSRNTSEEELLYSKSFGYLVSEEGCSLVSGASKGIDESSMMGALEHDGTVIGVVSDSLIKRASSSIYREFIQKNNLVLISITNPEAPFNVGNAMQRNKMIYCLSDAAIVVVSGKEGGTISGALENIRNKWVRLFVKESLDMTLGNIDIVKNGAQWLPKDIQKIEFDDFFKGEKKITIEQTSLDF